MTTTQSNGLTVTSRITRGYDPEYDMKIKVRESLKGVDINDSEINKLKTKEKYYEITIKNQKEEITNLKTQLEDQKQNDLYKDAKYRSLFVYFMYLFVPSLIYSINDYTLIPNIITYTIAMIYVFISILTDYNKKVNGKFRNENIILQRLLWLSRNSSIFDK
jgi:hypothetical protein